ncbi:diguanylate cyclase [Desulfosediminicola flagellatus]|uniref:diguanylate cyclase n=1 Tax=Desulfosediminicola flagellatus TaxID=2569541 RepID=UPI0010AD270F|nr:diguanylate cyclase [Desulfosediminicola flagellatus]
MESIRAAIIECRNTAANEDEFILKMQDLITEHGNSVYPVIFNTLTTLDLPLKTAEEYWHTLKEHRRKLIWKLDREVNLVTALSDFLATKTNFLPNARLVDSRTFDRIVTGTTHDTLTGLFNRTYFDETFEQQVSLAKRYNTDLSILFLDIDDFKEVNDSLGHIAGDVALQEVASAIRRAKRESDIAARYGGEEFVLLMPLTPNVSASILAERIRKEIETTHIHYDKHVFSLTISGGLASYPLNSVDPKDLLQMADSAVYLAKGAGKNLISQFKREQRRYLRVKLRKPILVQELGFDDEQVFSGHCKDIGMGGILFETPSPLALGSTQKMSVPVNNGDPVLLIGKVVRIEKSDPDTFNIGLSFSFKEMAKTASNQIATFLKENEMPEIPDFRSH